MDFEEGIEPQMGAGYGGTALDRYVNADDGALFCEVAEEPSTYGGYQVVDMSLTSQRWMGIRWRHSICLITPERCMRSGSVLIYLDGSAAVSKAMLEMLADVAVAAQLPVAFLGGVPNQPLFGLREDALIAYTLRQYLATGEEMWPLLLPMTKSVVSCMTALASYFEERKGFRLDGFVIGGASKRGWTSWLTAAIDARVKGIISLAYDNLDIPSQLANQLRVWGQYSPMISDYTDIDVEKTLATETGQKLVQTIDPYWYLDRLAVPKLIVLGTNDPYWPLGAISLYFGDLAGRSYVLMMPNAGHHFGDLDRLGRAVAAFLLHVSGAVSLPEITWSCERCDDDRKLVVEVTASSSVEVSLWEASAATEGEFLNARWSRLEGESTRGQRARFTISRPIGAVKAAFADVTVAVGQGNVSFSSTPFIFGEDGSQDGSPRDDCNRGGSV